MAENPLRKPLNRAEQLPRQGETLHKGIKLYDIDSAIFEYMNDVVVPKLTLDGSEIKIPIMYGNAERWKSAQIDGVYRDKRGKLQLPLIMYKRTTLERNDTLEMPNRLLSYPTYKTYSAKNRYDKFSILNNFKPRKELYDITMPDYVNISYEVMVWTNYTEHMNTVVEAFKWAGDEYWGDKNKFKFKVIIDSFEPTQELTDTNERLIRTTFTMLVKAYLLPERFDNESTIKKTISTRAVITTLETDVSGRASADIATNDYNANKILYDYLEINGSVSVIASNPTTVIFNNVKVVTPPAELEIDNPLDTIKVYINGVKYSSGYYSASFNSNSITYIFNTGSLDFELDGNDSVSIAGKFIELS